MAGAVLQRAERRARDAGNGEELPVEGLELPNGLAHVTCRGRGADGPSSYSIRYIWVNYKDLTATSLESWQIREIIPKWPYFRLVNYYNLP